MRRRVVIFQDYDGCYSIAAPNGVDNELNGKNKRFYKENAELVLRLSNIPREYNVYLDQITRGANAVSVYVGSDRQSYELDKFNSENNQNGSVFPALQSLCDKRTSEAQQWTFEPRLLADRDYRGQALEAINRRDRQHLQAPRPSQYTTGGKPSKIPLVTTLMWDAYKQYPGEQLEFHFVDDRQDLIDDIIDNLDRAQIPPGMTLNISKFDYISAMLLESGALGLVRTIRSPHPAAVVEPPPLPQIEAAKNLNIELLKQTTAEYLEHLKAKLKAHHIVPQENNAPVNKPNRASPMISKLVERYNAIAALNTQIKDQHALNDEEIKNAQQHLEKCIDNKPDWSERSFIQRLTDVLSLGLKPLYRTFFSKETTLQEKIQREFSPKQP